MEAIFLKSGQFEPILEENCLKDYIKKNNKFYVYDSQKHYCLGPAPN